MTSDCVRHSIQFGEVESVSFVHTEGLLGKRLDYRRFDNLVGCCLQASLSLPYPPRVVDRLKAAVPAETDSEPSVVEQSWAPSNHVKLLAGD